MYILRGHWCGRWLLVPTLALGGLALIGLLSALGTGPEVIVSDLEVGVFTPGQTVERVLPIENRGGRTLEIRNVKACCGVTLPLGYPQKIAPRSSSCIVLRIHLPFTFHPWERTLALTTNDRKRAAVSVRLTAQADPALKIEPATIDLGYIADGNCLANAATIRTAAATELSPYIAASVPYLKASLRKDTSGRGHVLDVAVAENAPPGRVREHLYVVAYTPPRRLTAVPVSGTIEHGLRARPEQVFFEVGGEKTTRARHIRLRVIHSQWRSFAVESSDCRAISAQLSRIDDNTFDLHVSLDPTQVLSSLDTLVRLRNPDGDTLQIPVLAIRRKTPQGIQQWNVVGIGARCRNGDIGRAQPWCALPGSTPAPTE